MQHNNTPPPQQSINQDALMMMMISWSSSSPSSGMMYLWPSFFVLPLHIELYIYIRSIYIYLYTFPTFKTLPIESAFSASASNWYHCSATNVRLSSSSSHSRLVAPIEGSIASTRSRRHRHPFSPGRYLNYYYCSRQDGAPGSTAIFHGDIAGEGDRPPSDALLGYACPPLIHTPNTPQAPGG